MLSFAGFEALHPEGEFSFGSVEEISSCQELLTYLTNIPPNTDNQYRDNYIINRLLYLYTCCVHRLIISVQILCIIDKAAKIIVTEYFQLYKCVSLHACDSCLHYIPKLIELSACLSTLFLTASMSRI